MGKGNEAPVLSGKQTDSDTEKELIEKERAAAAEKERIAEEGGPAAASDTKRAGGVTKGFLGWFKKREETK